MLAPIIVQTLGRGIEVALKAPEQHGRETQGVVPAGRQAIAEQPIIEPPNTAAPSGFGSSCKAQLPDQKIWHK